MPPSDTDRKAGFVQRNLEPLARSFARCLPPGVKHRVWQWTVRWSPPAIVIPKLHLRRFLPLNPVVVDAGAHIGVDTVEMSWLWRKGRIFAFEPVPDLFAQLQANTRDRSNVRCFPLALGERAGESTMFVSTGASDASSSLLRPTGHLADLPEVRFDQQIKVRTITLDAWAQEQGLSAVDLLWLDMQGYELSVLRASPRILQTVRAIHMEVSEHEQYAGAPLYSEVRQWLSEQGFQVKCEALQGGGGNVLFLRG